MPSVFHYTSIEGLLGIISSRTLFATHYGYLNDAAEGNVIRNLIMPLLEAEIAELFPKLEARNLLAGFYDFHGASGRRTQAEGMYKALVKVANDISPIFVASFCRHDEGQPPYKDGLLSQWRGYADGGGVAIEFDEGGIDALVAGETKKYALNVVKSDDVHYERYEVLFDANAYKGFAGATMRDVFSNIGHDISDLTGDADIDAIVRNFVTTAPYMKHGGFAEEREYRIAAARVRKDKIPPSSALLLKAVKFRTRNGLIIPYIEIFGENTGTLPILSFVVGPHPLQEKQVDAIKLAVQGTPFAGAKVRTSDIPYRK